MRAKALVDVATKVLQVAMIAGGAAMDGFRGAVVGLVAGATAGGIISLYWAHAVRSGPAGPSSVSSRELIRFGAWGLLTNAVGLVLSTADIFCLSALLKDPAAVGVYSLASLLQQGVGIPMRAYLDARFPEMARASSDLAALMAMRKRMQRHMIGIAVSCSAVVALVAPPLLPRIFGKDFAASAVPLWILLCGQIAWSAGATQGRTLLAAGWVEGNFWAGVAAAITNVAAQLLLIPGLGIAGAATATALTNGLIFAVTTAALFRWWEARRLGSASRD